MTISVRASRTVGSRFVQCQTKCTMSNETRERNELYDVIEVI